MQTTPVAAHYDANYFRWQNAAGKVGGSLNAQNFSPFIGADDAVLDFGCGGGWVLSSISANRKLGIDINSSARDFARSIGVNTISSLDEAEDGAFDVVISKSRIRAHRGATRCRAKNLYQIEAKRPSRFRGSLRALRYALPP